MQCTCNQCGSLLEASWSEEQLKDIYEVVVRCPKCGEYRGFVLEDGRIIKHEINNPKVVIVSDGIKTVLYVDGKKVEKAMECDFRFHADLEEVSLTYTNYKTDKNGTVVINDDENELVTETHTWHR